MSRGVLDLVLKAMFIALVAVATMSIRIPMIGTQGYINVGDTIIFLAAALLGPSTGFVAGSFGSAIADLFGYPQWAPWTFVIKGIEGWIAGIIVFRAFQHTRAVSGMTIFGFVTAALWMNVGDYIAAGSIYGFTPALADIPGNLIQGGASVVLATVLLYALRRADVGSNAHRST